MPNTILLLMRQNVSKYHLFVAFFLLLNPFVAAQVKVNKIQVDYQTTPLGIDEEVPFFSWQMQTQPAERGKFQSAYQIEVLDENNHTVWNSEKRDEDVSVGIPYEGKKLESRRQYTVRVSVWDEEQNKTVGESYFETGLLNPKESAWNGAQWIGGSAEDLNFYSHYLSVFKLDYTLQLEKATRSKKASFVLGANDRRLQDRNKNIQGVLSKKNESYVEFELDLSQLSAEKDETAFLNIYRVGYAPGDSPKVPFAQFPIAKTLLNLDNQYEKHQFYISCVFGFFEIFMDGLAQENKISLDDDKSSSPRRQVGFNVNPVGTGNNYISFPMLADVGFKVKPKQKAHFSSLNIKHYRSPSNIVFQEKGEAVSIFNVWQKKNAFWIDSNGYHLQGGAEGVVVISDPSRNATPMLRTQFDTNQKEIKKARIYATARGIYELYLNGERIGNDYFNPGLTQYNTTQMYQTYDITSLLNKRGKNVLGAWLSEGWWSGNITYTGENWNYFGDRQSLLAQLIITYEDGSEQIIGTNPTHWKIYTEGPIRYGSFFQGEVYDANKEASIEGWSTIDYHDENWKNAVTVPLKGTQYKSASLPFQNLKIIGQLGKNASIVKTLQAQSVSEVRPGVFVYDMGQNMVGFPRIKLPKDQTKDTITLRYAEVKYPKLSDYKGNEDMVMLENIRAALTQDIYIRARGKEATIAPRFTFHGYRFIEITGIDNPLPLAAVEGSVVSSIDSLASYYETSNSLVNKLWQNITWSLRGNFLSIPTDTPARNERMGWSGDINVFSKSATYLTAADPFLRRHLLAMRDIQSEQGRFSDVAPVGGGFGGTLWGSAGIVIPWELYLQYGDKKVLAEHYEAMKHYMTFLNTKINPDTGILNEGPLGDWLSPEEFKNDPTLLWTAYHIFDLNIVKQTASLLGFSEEATEYERQYQERKTFFNLHYVHPDHGKTLHLGNQSLRFGPALPPERQKKAGDIVDTQVSYAVPLALNAFNANNKQMAQQHLVKAVERENEDEYGIIRPKHSLMTGFIGTASINPSLSKAGRHDLAYRLLQQTSYPSWLYSVKNGATTIWERLNSFTLENGFGGNNSMNSFNHYSFGAVAAWMNSYSLGIQRDEKSPGFKHFILQPTPDPTGEMKYAKGHYDSVYGRIESAWKTTPTGWEFETTIPPNTSAIWILEEANQWEVLEHSKGEQKPLLGYKSKKVGTNLHTTLPSGKYHFKITKKK